MISHNFGLMQEKMSSDTHWVYIASTIDELINYHASIGGFITADATRNFLLSNKKGCHYTNALTCALTMIADLKKTDFWAELGKVTRDMFDFQSEQIAKGKTIFINSVGGYNSGSEWCDLIKTVRKEEALFPDLKKEKPRYLQWPNGTHWYVKIGNHDVVVGSNQKWNTKTQAEKAYKQWLKEREE